MKNKFPTILVSVFFILSTVLNACSPQSAPATLSTPSPVPDAVKADTPLMTETAAATATAGPSQLSAVLSEITGKVKMKKSADIEFTPAVDQSFLDENGQAMTGGDGHLRLDLSTGTIVRIAPNSLFTLVSNEPADGSLKTRLQLTIGKLFVILNGGSLEVDTPTGTAAVRGSYLSVNYDSNSGEVRITCLEGHCSLGSAGGTVEITAGQTAVITGVGQPPQVGEMTEADLQDWLNNNPEAKVMVDALSEPPAPPAVYIAPIYIRPAVITKPKDKEEEPTQPSPTPTPAPSLVSTVVISNLTPTSVLTGQPLAISINVQPSVGGPMPTGTVKVRADTNYFCSATLDSAGNATCVGGIPSAGFYSLTADYLGDTSYLPGQSSSVVEFGVFQASTTTTLVSHSPSPSLVGTEVTFTATVDVLSPGSGMPTGIVTFTDGSVNNCNISFAAWTCKITFAAPGAYSMQALYSGDLNFSGSSSAFVTHNVLANSDTVLQAPGGPTGTIAVCNPAYQVQVLDVDGVSGVQVEYRIGDSVFAVTDPKQALTWNASTGFWEGSFTITALNTETVYWRFIATDGVGNKTFLGNGVTSTSGYTGFPVDSYFYTGPGC